MNKELYENYEVQQALQQEQLNYQQVLNAPALHEQMQQNQSALVEQTNPKKVIRDIILRLQGLEEKPDGELRTIAEAKLNKCGIDNIWYILDSHINQNIIFSHLDSKEIKNIMNQLQKDLVDDFTLNWKEYGIKKKTDLDIINNSILVNIYLAMKRAEGQNEKNWIGKISVENISSNSKQLVNKKEGIWSKFRL